MTKNLIYLLDVWFLCPPCSCNAAMGNYLRASSFGTIWHDRGKCSLISIPLKLLFTLFNGACSSLEEFS
jgi:hypothetical protein